MSRRVSVLHYGVNHFRLRQNAIGQLIQPSPPRQQPASVLIRPRQTPLKIPRIQLKSDPKLPRVIQANRPPWVSLHQRQGRQQNVGQNPNNGNHNQQINQRKRLGLPPQPRQKQIVHSLPQTVPPFVAESFPALLPYPPDSSKFCAPIPDWYIDEMTELFPYLQLLPMSKCIFLYAPIG